MLTTSVAGCYHEKVRLVVLS